MGNLQEEEVDFSDYEDYNDVPMVLAAFSAFVIKGVYPFWTLLLIGAMFLQFILTSGLRRPVYDPVGKANTMGRFSSSPSVSRWFSLNLLSIMLCSLVSLD